MGRIAEALEREAGHVVVSLILIALGAGLWMLKVPKGEDPIPFATGVLDEKHDWEAGESTVMQDETDQSSLDRLWATAERGAINLLYGSALAPRVHAQIVEDRRARCRHRPP